MAKLRAYEINALQDIIVNKLEKINEASLLPEEEVRTKLFKDYPELVTLEATVNEIKVLEKKIDKLQNKIDKLPLKEIAAKEDVYLSSNRGDRKLIGNCIEARKEANTRYINKSEIRNKIIVANLGGETAQTIIDEIINSYNKK